MAWEIGPRRRGDLSVFHLSRHGRDGGAPGRHADHRRCRPDTFNLDPASCERAVATAISAGSSRARSFRSICSVCRPITMPSALSRPRTVSWCSTTRRRPFGATYRGKKLGTLATATATSFFPAKPLGCYGDGGAVFTDDDALATRVKSFRLHGEGADRSEAARIGITGRLDTIQAAVLIEKLKIFPDEILARNRVAARYSEALADVAAVPRVRQRIKLGVGAVHAAARARAPRCTRRRAESRRHSDRDLLHQATASPAGLSRLPGSRRRRAGQRTTCRRK